MFCLLPVAILVDPPISVAPGYYTLAELSTLAAKQNLVFDVRPDCAEEVYAIRLSRTSAQGLIDALRATGRLTLEADGATWRIRRSEGDRDEDRDLLGRYFGAIFRPVLDDRAAAAQRVRTLLGLPEEAAKREAAALRTSDKPEVARLVRGFFSSSVKYAQLTLPTVLSEGPATIGRARQLRVASTPDLFFPRGLSSRVPPFSGQSLAFPSPPDIAAAKIGFDPASGAAALRMCFGFSDDSLGLCLTNPLDILRAPSVTPPTTSEVHTRASLARFQARIAQTETALRSDVCGKTVPVPNRSLRLTEAALLIAKAADQDLVAYVSPLGERPLAKFGEASLRSLVLAAGSGAFDSEFFNRALQERTGMLSRPITPRAEPTVSAVAVGSVVVLRPEADYLDLMLDGPPALPGTLENQALNGREPSLSELLTHVAELKIGSWRGPTFSSRYFPYTNPLALYPFARVWRESPMLAKAIAAPESISTYEIPVSQLEPNARRDLATALQSAADLCDNASRGFQVLSAGDLARRGKLGKVSLRVSREKERILFELLLPVNSVPKPIWAAWAERVRSQGGS